MIIGGNDAFSIGYIFYYWDYYALPKSNKNNFYWNINDHSGYEPHELYIKIKYSSLKEELMNNNIFSLLLNEYALSYTKAMKYKETAIIKEMQVVSQATDLRLHYGLKPGSKLSDDHLMSLIIYCDWTELSTKFSSTFRKANSFQTMKEIKSRNHEYANWSKSLREAVQYFGRHGWDYDENDKYNQKDKRVKGPFYCGMSKVMAIPEYSIRLCSPTSTSKQIEVATRFGGDSGMIIQINNNGYYESWNLRCFDCSWLSNYTNEDEYLFFGGDWRIKIESIRHIKTAKNYQRFMDPLFYFDCMVNGTSNYEYPTFDEYDILQNLMKHYLDSQFDNGYGKYVNDLFDAFVNHKTQIILNLHEMDINRLNPWIAATKAFIMYGLDSPESAWMRQHVSYRKMDSPIQYNNIFKPEILFKLFKNVKEIIIYTTDSTGTLSYTIEISELLDLLRLYHDIIPDNVAIILKAIRKDSKSWISMVWDNEKPSLSDEYKKSVWNMAHKDEINASSIWNMYKKQDVLVFSNSKDVEEKRIDPNINMENDLYIGNVHNICNKKDWYSKNKEKHEWILFMSLSKDKLVKPQSIKRVTYYLHRSFRNSECVRHLSPFICAGKGWGTFRVQVKIEFLDKCHREDLYCNHHLDFRHDVTLTHIGNGVYHPTDFDTITIAKK